MAFIANWIIGWLPVLLMVGLAAYLLYRVMNLLARKAPKAGLWIGILWFCWGSYELLAATAHAFSAGLCPGKHCWTISYFYIFGLLSLSAAAHLITACRKQPYKPPNKDGD